MDHTFNLKKKKKGKNPLHPLRIFADSQFLSTLTSYDTMEDWNELKSYDLHSLKKTIVLQILAQMSVLKQNN